MTEYQIKTAENAKKKLKELEEFKKILEAAIEGKVIMFKDRYYSGTSEFGEIDFTFGINNYSVVKEKQKVYTFYYIANNTGRIWSYSNPDYNTYRLTLEQIMSGMHDRTILKETVEEFEL